MTTEQKVWVWRAVAILPIFIGAWFIVFSQKELYTAADNFLNKYSFTASTTISSEQMLGQYPFRLGLDLSSGVRLTYIADTSAIASGEVNDSLSVLREVIERRVNAFGVSEPIVQIESGVLSKENKMLVELPGLTDVNQALELIGQTPTLEFVLERPASSSESAAIKLAAVVFNS